MTYSTVTINTTLDKNLDSMGYKFWVPMTVSGSILSEAVTMEEKYCPHFKTEEDARQYIDYCKDANASADGNAAYVNTRVADSA